MKRLVGNMGHMKNLAQGSLRVLAEIRWQRYASWVGILIVVVFFAWLSPFFLSFRNITILIQQVAVIGILAVGMTFVIISGGIDLSVGSVVALSAVVFALTKHLGSPTAFLLAMLVGIACGAFNGLLIAKFRLAPFIVTLAMMTMARGLALILTAGRTIYPLNEDILWMGQGYINPAISLLIGIILGCIILIYQLFFYQKIISSSRAGNSKIKKRKLILFSLIPIGVVLLFTWIFANYRGIPIAGGIFMICGFMMIFISGWTKFGQYVYAIGSNKEAARSVGIKVQLIEFLVYLTMGGLAVLAGMVLMTRVNMCRPTAGQLLELDAIAAAILGGASFIGGMGTVGGSMVGALFIATLNNGMNLMGISSFVQIVVKGGIITFAALMDLRRRM